MKKPRIIGAFFWAGCLVFYEWCLCLALRFSHCRWDVSSHNRRVGTFLCPRGCCMFWHFKVLMTFVAEALRFSHRRRGTLLLQPTLLSGIIFKTPVPAVYPLSDHDTFFVFYSGYFQFLLSEKDSLEARSNII